MQYRLYFLLFILFLSSGSYAQYDIRNVEKVERLSSGTITAIAQDHHGFIWIGTRNGLSRYDGHDVKTYDDSNSNLNDEDISAILVDSKKRMWVGTTDKGLSLYISESDSFRNFRHIPSDPQSLSCDEIKAIHEDIYGRIWVGTKRGLNLLDSANDSFRVYWMPPESPGSTGNIIQAIASDSLGNLWAGTFGGGLRKFDTLTNSFSRVPGNEQNLAKQIYSLAVYSPEELIIGTRDNGLLSYDTETREFTRLPLCAPKDHNNMFVRTILIDKDKNLWLGTDGIGTDGNGLYKLSKEKGRWEQRNVLDNQFNLTPDLSNAIYSLFIDYDGNLWVGSAWRGLMVLENRNKAIKFLYGDITGEKPTPVWSIFRSGSNLWLGTDGRGLNIYDLDKRKIKRYNRQETSSPRFDGEYVQIIQPREDGKYWIGTYLNGLILFDPDLGQIKKYMHDPSDSATIAHDDVHDLIKFGEHEYWVATRGGGLNYFNEKFGSFRAFRHDLNDRYSLSNNNVIDLEPAEGNKIWVATYGGGVNLFDPETEKFIRFEHSENDESSLSSNKVTSLYQDSKGYLWVSTSGKGLNRINARSFEIERFGVENGFQGEIASGILEDNDGNIWVSTKKGIYKYVAEENYFYHNPNLSGDYLFAATFKDEQKGTLFFGSLDGVVYFNPSGLEIEPQHSNIKITDFKLFNKSVAIGPGKPLSQHILHADEIILDYDQSVLTFEFAALQFPFSEDHQYALQMENFDKEWRDNGSNRTVTYTNLSPGEYTFKVKSVNRKNPLVEEVASIKLTINKPFWAEWWAYIFYVVLVLLLLSLFRRYSIYWEKIKNQLKLEQLSREKEAEIHEIKLRFFTNISHEIRTPVTLILGSINRMLDIGITHKSQHTAIENIKKNGHHLLNLVGELLDFRKLESGDVKLKVARGHLAKFIKEIFLSFSEQAGRKSIRYDFSGLENPVHVWFDRDEMEKVLYNIIANAFKFTDASGAITVSVCSDDQFAYLSVKDTGKGIPPEQLSEIFKRFYQSDTNTRLKNSDTGYGLGLAIAHDIVKLHGGEILVESEPDKGTVFTIKLQLGKSHIRSEFILNNFQDSEELSHYMDAISFEREPVHFNFPDQSDMTVLIAEDNEGLRDYLYDLLKEHFQVILAENGREALELSLSHLPDLIVSDVMMPEMDGITFTSKIKNDPRTSHIPVIILTARSSLIYKKEGLDIGVDDYITKPFSETLLKTRIRNLLNNRLLLRERYKTELLVQPKELAIRSPDQEFLSKLVELLEGKMDSTNLNMEFISRELGMSQSNIYKKLKSLTGMSIVEFVRDFRLKHAAQLIVKHRLSVTEVCFKVGFNDRRYFSQVFKSKYGVTPSEYAREHVVTE